MWATDRDLEEHSVFDHKSRENGLNAIYSQPHLNGHHTHHIPIYSGVGGHHNGGNGIIVSSRIMSPLHNGSESHYSSLPPIDDDDDDVMDDNNTVDEITDDGGAGSDDTRGLSHQVRPEVVFFVWSQDQCLL